MLLIKFINGHKKSVQQLKCLEICIFKCFSGFSIKFDKEKWSYMYVEQFLKNDTFSIFSNNFVTPILNLVIEVQKPLFPSNDNIIFKTQKWVKLPRYWKLVKSVLMLSYFLNYFILATRKGRRTKRKHYSRFCSKFALEFTDYRNTYIALTLICIKQVPEDSRTTFLATIFTHKMPESSGSMYSSILMLEKI